MASDACAIALGKRAAAEEGLAIAEYDLQRIRDRGAGHTSARDRYVMRAPNFRALPYPVAGKSTPDVNAKDERNGSGHLVYSEPFMDAPDPPLTSAEHRSRVPHCESEQESMEGDSSNLYAQAPVLQGAVPSLDILERIRRSFLGCLYDTYHYHSITDDIIRAHGYRNRAAFVLLRDQRLPHMCLAIFFLAFVFLFVQII